MTDAHGVAHDQLKTIVQRVERLEAEIADLNADKSEIYKEARAFGFDVKAIKKVVSQRKLDEHKREEQDFVFETYWNAVHGLNLVHAPARENIEEFDPITGEFVEEFRAKAGEGANTTMRAASSDPVSRTDDVRERQHVSTVDLADDCRTGGKEQSAAAVAPVGDAGAHAEGIPTTNPENDPSEDRREGHSPESVNPTVTGGIGANVGGDHVTAPASAATKQAGPLVIQRPAKALRPLCKNPGEHCGGYGSTHCGSCLRASKEAEVAA